LCSVFSFFYHPVAKDGFDEGWWPIRSDLLPCSQGSFLGCLANRIAQRPAIGSYRNLLLPGKTEARGEFKP